MDINNLTNNYDPGSNIHHYLLLNFLKIINSEAQNNIVFCHSFCGMESGKD